MDANAVEVVRAWHEALNGADVERLVALSSDDIEMGGPRGPARGAQVLREWVGRAGVRLTPRRMFQRQGDRMGAVVVEQDASWPLPGSSEPGEPQVVASVFVVSNGRVNRVARHPDLASALEAGDLTVADKV